MAAKWSFIIWVQNENIQVMVQHLHDWFQFVLGPMFSIMPTAKEFDQSLISNGNNSNSTVLLL